MSLCKRCLSKKPGDRPADGGEVARAVAPAGAKITIFDGIGALGPDRTVTVTGPEGVSTIRGGSVVLAAGSVPRTIPGFEPEGPVMTSDEVLMLDYVPGRVAVIGGGAIGCEFASTFADLGSQVTILEFLPKILPGLDSDVANVVVRSFKKKNIDIRTGVKVLGHTPNDLGGTVVQYAGDDGVVQAANKIISEKTANDALSHFVIRKPL